MIDINLIRQNPQLVHKASKDKGFDVNIFHILEIDKKYRELSLVVQNLRAERNQLTETIKGKPIKQQIEKGREIKNRLEKEEHALNAVAEELKMELYKIPNLPKEDVKAGKDESQNEVIRKHKDPVKFSFTPKDHLDLGEALDIIDVKRAAKISGSRFAYLKNEGVLLEFALVQLAMETLMKEGFIPVVPPVLFRRSVAIGLGYFHGKDNDQYYWVYEPDLKTSNPEDHPGYYLAGTAEHSIVPMHKDEIFNENVLPKRYVGFSSAFRREAGSYGKDTRGILRVHQFDKVEMVSFTTEENDDKEHEYLLSLQEKLFQLLDIPYQVVKMCTGDLGFPVARKYDLEAWMPGENKYREVTSGSTTTDFQSRRLNIKYSEDENKKKYAHILNGTAFAIGRTIIAILENYQQDDGSVLVPKVLQKYLPTGKAGLHFKKITPKK